MCCGESDPPRSWCEGEESIKAKFGSRMIENEGNTDQFIASEICVCNEGDCPSTPTSL